MVKITAQWKDELRNRLTLSEIIGQTVKLQRTGNEFKACCPFHHEKTPSFTVNDAKGFYHCFGCGAHGDAIGWMIDHQGLPFPEALRELSDQASLPLPQVTSEQVAKEKKSIGLRDVMDAAQAVFANNLMSGEGGEARQYLMKRGFSRITAENFGLGYAPPGYHMLEQSLKKIDTQLQVEGGLLIQVDNKPPYSRFRHRLMVPIHDARGRVIAFGGRILGDGEPKYLNSPQTPLFDKGRSIFNIHRAASPARKENRLIVVEGYLDVIALAQAGVEAVVAPLGTALTEAQIRELWRYVDRPTLCFDGDNAGHKAAARAALRIIEQIKPGKSIEFVTLPAGKDPDDIIQEFGVETFLHLLKSAHSLAAFLFKTEIAQYNISPGPDGRAKLFHRIDELIGLIKDPILAREYRQEMRDLYYQYMRKEREKLSPHIFRKGGKPYEQSFRAKPSHNIGTHNISIVHNAEPSPGERLENAVQKAIMEGLFHYPQFLFDHFEKIEELILSDDKLARLRDRMLHVIMEHDKPDQQRSNAYEWPQSIHDMVEQIWPQRTSSSLQLPFSFSREKHPHGERDLLITIDLIFALNAVRKEAQKAEANCKSQLNEETYAEHIQARKKMAAIIDELNKMTRNLAEENNEK